MPLLLSGRGFRRELEAAGCMAIHVPLEGGAETRLLRRLRAAGYNTYMTSARGLGDVEVFLFEKQASVLPISVTRALAVVRPLVKCKR